ncbi:helix-turn-helix domain-containing protein [[Pseudomonas] boreopolis]|uniref:Helix-turn-helix domain-containing protein n=1 Tax=Xanthomonas boreopolis TaxID=86183 RepID=A0A919KII2_9XANT|nr:hypothetical protein GCM10009090_17910 [[Pseudomonas] boreopolis]
MSNALSSACRPLQMPPTPKSVLMAMADYSDEAGRCWPSIPTLCEWTCFSRRAVIDAIAWLEKAGAIVADRSNGRHTSYVLTPSGFVQPVRHMHQCSSCTGADSAQTSASPAPDPCISRTGPVQQPHPNHQEPPITISKATTKKRRASAPIASVDRPDDVTEQTWADWLALRKAKRAPVTETVLRDARREAERAALPLTRFLEIWCLRGSQGLQADWLKPHERAGPLPNVLPLRPSASADFRGKTYAGTAIEDLPPDLRDAARAALAAS